MGAWDGESKSQYPALKKQMLIRKILLKCWSRKYCCRSERKKVVELTGRTSLALDMMV